MKKKTETSAGHETHHRQVIIHSQYSSTGIVWTRSDKQPTQPQQSISLLADEATYQRKKTPDAALPEETRLYTKAGNMGLYVHQGNMGLYVHQGKMGL